MIAFVSHERAPLRAVTWRERSRLVRWWRLWHTRRPRTFTEKVRYKMLRDHRELMVTFADKSAVRVIAVRRSRKHDGDGPFHI